MNGSACNGWRFWSLASEAKPKSSAAPAKAPKAEQTIKPMKGAEGRFFCSACQDAFASEESEPACPQGHTNAPAEEAPKAAKKTAANRKAAKAKP
jgi:hypothetical protein